MCQVPGDVLGTDDLLLVMEDVNEKHYPLIRVQHAKTDLIVSAGQKWVWLEMEYLHSSWIYDARI